jgi:preprotein translocase subunit SecF
MTTTQTRKRMKHYNFDFIGKFWFFGGISALAVLISLGLVIFKGFNYGIDFSGGTEVQVRFAQPVEVAKVRQFTDDLGFKEAQVQRFGEENEYLIRLENPKAATERETSEALKAMTDNITAGLKEKFAAAVPEVRRIDSVGPQVGSQLKRNSFLAGFYSLLILLIYIGLRFDYKYAPGAILCLVHDAMLVLGAFSLLGKEINISFLASILTLIGFSLNDTIITYDRIRENEHILKGQTTKHIINRSINDMLSRTFLTSFTVFMAVISLYLFAGGVIEDFALAMLIGIVVGVYSSVYVAAPFILLVERFDKKRRRA